MFGFIPSIAAHGTFAMPMEDVKVGMVDIRDIAAVAVKALTEKGHEGKTFIITGPEALSYDDVAEKLSAAFGKKVTYVKVAQEEFKKGLVEVGTLEWYADALLELMKYVVIPQGSLVTNVVAEVAKKQPISFDQFAQDYAAMFKNN
jgi:uncharacterized protein YbjT (DUF2867 family)